MISRDIYAETCKSLKRVSDSLATFIRENSDPGTEALAALDETRRFLIHRAEDGEQRLEMIAQHIEALHSIIPEASLDLIALEVKVLIIKELHYPRRRH